MGDRREPFSHRASSTANTTGTDVDQQSLAARSGWLGPRPLRCTKLARSGNRARTCRAGSRASIASPLAVKHGGEAYADVGHQQRPADGALLDQVEHVAPVQHRQVRVLRGPVDQPVQRGPRDPLQRRLPLVGRAELVDPDAQAVPALLGQVGRPARGARVRRAADRSSIAAARAARQRRRPSVPGAGRAEPVAPAPGRPPVARDPPNCLISETVSSGADLSSTLPAAIGWAMAKPLPVTVGIGPARRSPRWSPSPATTHRSIISGESLAEVGKTREVIEALADDHEPHYGVSTGFGPWLPGTSRPSCAASCSAA